MSQQPQFSSQSPNEKHSYEHAQGHGHGHSRDHRHDHSQDHEADDKWAENDYDGNPLIEQFSETSYNGIISSLRTVIANEAELKSFQACDVGAAGTGLVTQHMQPFFQSIHAFDTSPSMLKRLSKRFPDGGLVTYSLLSLSPDSANVLKSGKPLPAPTVDDPKRQVVPPRTCFDVVYGSLMLHHVEDLDGFFVGLKSIVKPGGWVVFSEFGSAEEDKEAVQEAETAAPQSSEIKFPGSKNDHGGTVNQPGHHHQVWSRRTITELFESYGFIDIAVDFKGRLHWDANNSIPLMVVRGRKQSS